MNSVVKITFELKDSDGNLLESSSEPISYLHGGYDNIFPKVPPMSKLPNKPKLPSLPSDIFSL